jgi:hypothetical protein
MATEIDDDTLMRCVAITALPDFIDLNGDITGTRNATYNPTFVGERGFMMYGTAKPMDLPSDDLPLGTGDLAVCYLHTMYGIDQELAGATPIEVVAQQGLSGPYRVTVNGDVRKYWIDSQKELVIFDSFGDDDVPDAGLHFADLVEALKDYPRAISTIQSKIDSLT